MIDTLHLHSSVNLPLRMKDGGMNSIGPSYRDRMLISGSHVSCGRDGGMIFKLGIVGRRRTIRDGLWDGGEARHVILQARYVSICHRVSYAVEWVFVGCTFLGWSVGWTYLEIQRLEFNRSYYRTSINSLSCAFLTAHMMFRLMLRDVSLWTQLTMYLHSLGRTEAGHSIQFHSGTIYQLRGRNY